MEGDDGSGRVTELMHDMTIMLTEYYVMSQINNNKVELR